MRDAPPPLAAGTLLEGRYRLVRPIGRGGMATVWEARDERLAVARAVKLLAPALVHRGDLRQRFESEARILAGLDHPHIVSVFDLVTVGGAPAIVMGLAAGGSLQGRLDQRGPLAPRAVIALLDPVMQAVSHAHGRGVIHRDLKPSNILMTAAGHPQVADFGLARVEQASQRFTRAGMALGTAVYMAPEQRLNARDVDARADVYSLGATLFALLTAEEPFDLSATTLTAEMLADLPPALHPVLARSTRADPGQRYPDVAGMRAALLRAAKRLEAAGPAGARRRGVTLVPTPVPQPQDTLLHPGPEDDDGDDDDLSLPEPQPELPFVPLPAGTGFHQAPTVLRRVRRKRGGEE